MLKSVTAAEQTHNRHLTKEDGRMVQMRLSAGEFLRSQCETRLQSRCHRYRKQQKSKPWTMWHKRLQAEFGKEQSSRGKTVRSPYSGPIGCRMS